MEDHQKVVIMGYAVSMAVSRSATGEQFCWPECVREAYRVMVAAISEGSVPPVTAR
jgi:hypothetical protein